MFYLKALPLGLSKFLPYLTNLYLCKNYIREIPRDIGQMSLLTVLDLSKVWLDNFDTYFKIIYDGIEM